jgi:hypothetical protein
MFILDPISGRLVDMSTFGVPTPPVRRDAVRRDPDVRTAGSVAVLSNAVTTNPRPSDRAVPDACRY